SCRDSETLKPATESRRRRSPGRAGTGTHPALETLVTSSSFADAAPVRQQTAGAGTVRGGTARCTVRCGRLGKQPRSWPAGTACALHERATPMQQLRFRFFSALALAAVLVAPSCDSADLVDNTIPCGANGFCPSGFECTPTNICVRRATGSPDGPPPI